MESNLIMSHVPSTQLSNYEICTIYPGYCPPEHPEQYQRLLCAVPAGDIPAWMAILTLLLGSSLLGSLIWPDGCVLATWPRVCVTMPLLLHPQIVTDQILSLGPSSSGHLKTQKP